MHNRLPRSSIVLDLDDVLANLRQTLYQVLSRSTGIDRHWHDWPNYDLCAHFTLDKSALVTLLVDEQVLELCEPESGAAAATASLAELGYELAIITARAWHPQAEAVTHHWLRTHGIHYDRLSVVPLGSNKLHALPPTEVVMAVDDHPDNIQRYQQVGIPTLMMHRPWNVNHSGERIHDLDAVVDLARHRINGL